MRIFSYMVLFSLSLTAHSNDDKSLTYLLGQCTAGNVLDFSKVSVEGINSDKTFMDKLKDELAWVNRVATWAFSWTGVKGSRDLKVYKVNIKITPKSGDPYLLSGCELQDYFPGPDDHLRRIFIKGCGQWSQSSPLTCDYKVNPSTGENLKENASENKNLSTIPAESNDEKKQILKNDST